MTKLDYDASNRDRDASFHVVAGKVRAQVSQAAVSVVRARQSNFNISTPSGVAAVRGTIVVLAYNPATQETLTLRLPVTRPGGLRRAGDVREQGWTGGDGHGWQLRPPDRRRRPQRADADRQPAAGGSDARSRPRRTASTQGSTELIVVSVPLPTPQETQNTANTGTGGTPPVVQVSNPAGASGPAGIQRVGQSVHAGPRAAAQNCSTATPVCPAGFTGTPPNCVKQSSCQSPPCE